MACGRKNVRSSRDRCTPIHSHGGVFGGDLQKCLPKCIPGVGFTSDPRNVPLSSHLVLPHAIEGNGEDWISGAYFLPTSSATLELLRREGPPNVIPNLAPGDMMGRCGSAFLSAPRTLTTAVAMLDFTTPGTA